MLLGQPLGVVSLGEIVAAASGTLTTQTGAVDLDFTVSADWVVNAADTTAPVLSSPTAASVGETTVTPTCTTDTAEGTMYMVVVPNGDSPSVAQIKAGQQSSGAAAIDSDSDVIASTGAHAFAQVTGLTASTSYELYFVHTDVAANDSTAATVGFTTNAVPGAGPTGTGTNIADVMYSGLGGLGYTGTVQERYRAWMIAENVQTPDTLMAFLEAAGYTQPNLIDRLYAYMKGV